MRTAARLASVVVLATLLACAAGAPAADTAREEAAIRALVTEWNGYLATQNDSAIAAMYGADAVLLPPGQPRVTGSDSIRRFWAQMWPMKASLTLSTASVRVAPSGDIAVEEGNWSFAMPLPGGEQRDHGKYLVVWSRATGSWKVAQDIWNSDQPTPLAGAPSTPAAP